MLSLEALRVIAPTGHRDILAAVLSGLPDAAARHAIDTPSRQAHFLAQLAHESDGFRTVREYATGRAYEGRADLGNTQPGDGARFKGRGLIQLTGRLNYRRAGAEAGLDLEGDPDLAADLRHVMPLAALFWAGHGLNALADADDIARISKRINGGLNGLASRKTYLARAKTALGAVPPNKTNIHPRVPDRPGAGARAPSILAPGQRRPNMSLLTYIAARFREPSTWAATGVGAVLIHGLFPGSLGDPIIGLFAAASALVAALLPEKASTH